MIKYGYKMSTLISEDTIQSRIKEIEAQAELYGDISQAIGTGIGAYLNRPTTETQPEAGSF